ncbi:MAG TPA: hypothetical protein VJT09_18025 [Pyrinomonadaceae bacterium]|nr:hypothetical protein [Pyrinomonadaceae bacterium]
MKRSFPRQCLALLVLLAVCASAAYAQRRRGAASTAAPPSELTGMKVLPYDRGSDTFADDIADSTEERLNELDLSFLVKVEVTGKPGEYASRDVTVTVREGNKLILTRTTMVGIFNQSGKYYVPVWIYGPLCQPTTVQATLMGQRRPSTIRKRLSFQCGE